MVANLGETLIFFQHNSGVRVTHGFGGSIGATSILPRSSSWRSHCDEKTHFVWKIHSPQVYSWVWFQASVFHGKLSWKTSCMFKGEAASLLSIFHLCHSHRCLILCSMFLVFRAYLYKLAAKKDSAPGFSKRCVFFWRSNFRLALSVNGSLGSCASLSSRICQEMPAKMITAFPDMFPSIEIGIVNLTWSSVHFISYQEKHLQSSKKQNKNIHKTCKDSKEPRFISKNRWKKNEFFPICHGPCLSLLSIWIFRVHLTHWSCVHIRSFDVMLPVLLLF